MCLQLLAEGGARWDQFHVRRYFGVCKNLFTYRTVRSVL